MLALSPADGVQEDKNISNSGSEVFGDDPVGDSGKGTTPSFDDSDVDSGEKPQKLHPQMRKPQKTQITKKQEI